MKNLILLASALLALVSCQASLGRGPLDGRVYEVALTGPDQKSQADQLIFDGGRFESTACRPYGFAGGPYTSSADSFSATAKSSKSGTTAWSGTLKGAAIEGSMQWTDDQGKTSDFRFSGKQASGVLDGRTYAGNICPAGKQSGDKDTLVFANGGFESRACRPYGFTITNYTATREGDTVHFTAVATNAEGESNHWEGVIQGDKVTGTMKHMNTGGKVTDAYDFEATLAT